MATRSSFRFVVPISILGVIACAVLFVGHMAKSPQVLVNGEIFLEKSLVPQHPEKTVLFITLFDESQNSPRPYAAFKSVVTPREGKITGFTLTPQNVAMMDPSAAIPQKFRVKARLDSQGLGGADKPGDLVGTIPSVQNGQRGMRLVINERIQ